MQRRSWSYNRIHHNLPYRCRVLLWRRAASSMWLDWQAYYSFDVVEPNWKTLSQIHLPTVWRCMRHDSIWFLLIIAGLFIVLADSSVGHFSCSNTYYIGKRKQCPGIFYWPTTGPTAGILEFAATRKYFWPDGSKAINYSSNVHHPVPLLGCHRE